MRLNRRILPLMSEDQWIEEQMRKSENREIFYEKIPELIHAIEDLIPESHEEI